MNKHISLKRGMKLFFITSFILMMTCGISACSKSNEETKEIKANLSPTKLAPPEKIPDPEPLADSTTNSQENDAGFYLNSNESVIFQQATWSFAKAYFTANQEQLSKCLAAGLETEVWDKDVFSQLSRLILKWNPQELSIDKVMDVQYEFMLEGEDSVTYLGMVLEYQDGRWVVQSYYLEK